MGLPATKFRGHDYMPLKLKGVMVTHGITCPRLALAVLRKDGQAVSSTTINLLRNWDYWPKGTTVESVKDQVETYLMAQGVPPEEIETIWTVEGGGDPYRAAQPVGAHASKPSPKPAGFRRTKPEFEPMEVEMLSPNAKRHFKLFRDPFQDDVASPEDVFLSGDQRYISEAMFQTAKHGGFVAIVGESGSGKSTLRKLLIERLRDQPIRVIFPQTLDKQKLNTGHICTAIINDLAPGQTVPGSPERQARKVRDVLLASSGSEFKHVLLIEEAHDISISTLKYLKRFYELEDGFKKLLSIILIGQPELKDKLDEGRHPEAREVIRRIEIAELAPLNSNLEEYIALKFQRVSIDPATVFGQGAIDAIRDKRTKTRPGTRETVSDLYPLIVNNLVIKAMNEAARIGAPLVSGELVRGL